MLTNVNMMVMDTKALAAQAAVDWVKSDMVVGLGSGSTATIFVDQLGQKIQQGQLTNIIGIPTSETTAQQAQQLGIPLGDLADYDYLDIAFDGADEVDPDLNLTKGWGGALVREKLVEIYAKRLVIMVDESKLVNRLGTRGPLPIEVSQFGWRKQKAWLSETLQCDVTRRMEGNTPYITDNQNFILCCTFAKGIADPKLICHLLSDRPGLVGHGLFLNMATDVIVGTQDGVRHLKPNLIVGQPTFKK